MRTVTALAAAAAALALAACGTAGDRTAAEPKPAAVAAAPLYERLGRTEGIGKVVDDLMVNIGRDARINTFFAKADPVRVRRLLVEQICAGSGGPCTYTGRSMVESHKQFQIREEHFNALVEDLVAALDKNGVPKAEQAELLAVLGPMKAEIVNVKG
ncbi:MAG TPA: group 1 truncated hemoglobin [Alphaproteobacteria bacterium]|nr:group 1 truncated hemoglobin [Alphaproteobacteria bacterium]